LLRPFYPALNGLRGCAILMVFVAHYGNTTPGLHRISNWGSVGVDLFFVLSGFLITGILFDTLHDERYFRNFYIRRALRIFPLFYGVWMAMLLLTPVLHIAWNRYNAAEAAYIGNFFYSGAYLHLNPQPGYILFAGKAPGHEGILNVIQFWSLCIEEQFYLVWPALIWMVRSRRHLLRLSLAIVALLPLVRIAYAYAVPHDAALPALYYGTFFRMDSLFLGAAIALWLRGDAQPATSIRRAASIAATVAPALLVAGCVLCKTHPERLDVPTFVDTVGVSLFAIAGGAILLLAIDPASWVSHALQQKPLPFLGRISYGLYVFHLFPLALLGWATVRLRPYHLALFLPVLMFAATVCVAWLSFRFFESPFLQLKSVLAPQPPTHPGKAVDVLEPNGIPVGPIA